MSISMKEVNKHKKAKSAWIVIHNDVYDVSKFLNEHPGGAEALLDVAGKDGTQAFEDVGHSEDARKMMKKYKIGSIPAEETIVHLDPCCGCKGPAHSHKVEKSWKTYDGSPEHSEMRIAKEKSPPRSPKSGTPVHTIIVPRQSRWWLWVLLAVGVAAGGAFAYKKYG